MKLALALLLLTTSAHADTDWAAGLVTATGIGIADRHAPSPAAAREPARHAAEDAARKQLAAKLPAIPIAGGGKVGDKLADAQVKARIDRAVAAAIVVDAVPDTDGSYKVTMAVPLEAIRQALATGPRALPATADADTAPAVVIVDGVPAAAKPALGWTVDAVAGPTLWVKTVPAWAKDAPHVKATSASGGAIKTAGGTGASEATLYVITGR
jgi:hypothetical protein